MLMKSLHIKSLGLLGGEPTLHPKILSIVRLSKKYIPKVTLYTNGRRLRNKNFVKNLKKSGLDFVNFSIQTGSKHAKHHDKTVCVKGAWLDTKKAIENCYKQKLKINIQTVLTHTNLSIYKEIIDEFSYVNLFIYYREIPKVTPDCSFFDQKVLSNNKTKSVYKSVYLYSKQKEVRTYLFSRMPLCWWNEKKEKEIFKSVTSYCHIINASLLTVDVDGSLLPCPQYVNMPVMSLLNNGKAISKDTFLREYQKGSSKSIREKLRYIPDKKCLSCKYLGIRCTGGCPLIDFKIGPNAPFL